MVNFDELVAYVRETPDEGTITITIGSYTDTFGNKMGQLAVLETQLRAVTMYDEQTFVEVGYDIKKENIIHQQKINIAAIKNNLTLKRMLNELQNPGPHKIKPMTLVEQLGLDEHKQGYYSENFGR